MPDTPRIHGDTVLMWSQDQVSCELDKETILMSIEEGMYYAMDPIGSRIWALLEQPRQVADLCNLLVQEYDVEPGQCEYDVLAFLHELVAYNLLRSCMTRLRKWHALTPTERCLLLEVMLLLAVSRVALRRLPLRWIATYIGQHQAIAEECGAAQYALRGHQVAWAVRVACRHLPWEGTCLVQAMAAKVALARRGCPATLYLGVAKDAHGVLEAHAWLRSAESFGTGGQNAERFTVISTFA